jgi:Flp pilus assembly protein CpaB
VQSFMLTTADQNIDLQQSGSDAALFILFVASNSGGGTTTTTEPTPTPVPTTVDLIVAARKIDRGTVLAASTDASQDVTTIPWPVDVPLPQGAMTKGDGVTTPGLEQVDKRIARVDILAGQPVQSFMLTTADQNIDLQQSGSDAALFIKSGQVAIAVPMSRLAGVAYAVRAGDHVDILVSYRFVDVDENFQTYAPNNVGGILVPQGTTINGEVTVAGRTESGAFGFPWVVIPSEISPRPRQATQLMIDNAVVLHVGDWPLNDTPVVVATTAATEAAATEAPAGEAAPTAVPQKVPDVVTLMMSRQDALVLKFSLEVGADIDFALRSAQDNALTDVSAENVNLQYLFDFYNLAEPPRLPIALDPRSDVVSGDPSGQFPHPPDPGQFEFPPVIPQK